MANEFKLSYTAKEIDDKLGEIDNAVKITAQTLTDEQKAQARANIGAAAVGEAGGGGAAQIDWKDITNKPFITEGSPDTLTWDGNTEGLANMGMFYKVSDVVPTKNDFSNGCIFATYRFAHSHTITAEDAQSAVTDDGFASFDEAMIIPYDNYILSDGTVAPEAGVYFLSDADRDTWTSLTIPGYTGFATEKIDPKCLYPIKWKDITNKPFITEGSDTLTWDGNTEGLVNLDSLLYKVSDIVPTLDDLVNGCTVTVNGDGIQLPCSAVQDGDLIYVSDENGSPAAMLVPFDNAYDSSGSEDTKVAEKGIYFLYYDIPGSPILVSSLTINGYTGFTTEKIAPSHLYQPDWNQTDETAADFIKNKPFKGKPTWDDVGSEAVVFYDEQNVSFTDMGVEFEISSAPAVGDTVTVEFDGVIYKLLLQDSGMGMLFVGNFGIVMGQPDVLTEPFCVLFAVDSTEGIILVRDLSQSHNIKITGRSITKIPNVYVKSYVRFCLGQNDDYIAHRHDGSERVTLDQLNEACASATLLLDYAGRQLYAPLIVDLFAGENYGSVTIMGKTGELKTYYTAEYTPET